MREDERESSDIGRAIRVIRNAQDRDQPVAELLSSWADELQSFAEIRHRYLAYA